ncbi:TlpA family protein disulfide reductase [Methylobacillus flagellatus]|uniref:TlpA family protein disulfide reductase n=1 Tax=Methylobacillus flagellatus TaxID=405 RepID=UPI0028541AA3|nr:TlpA disulfide reductase family protein [Methylobacillus flagellatus]MDR5172526.1 TlpA family protein disulfide reductase [Methylobacillus flagellatus]
MRRLLFILLLVSGSHAAAEPAWDFKLPTLDGTRFVELRQVAKPVLVNFWGVDCPPCVAELPMLDQFAAQRPDWSVLLVNTDSAAMAQRFLDQHPVSSTVLRPGMNVTGLMRKAGNKIGVLPFTVALDKNEHICFRKPGALTVKDLEKITADCR